MYKFVLSLILSSLLFNHHSVSAQSPSEVVNYYEQAVNKKIFVDEAYEGFKHFNSFIEDLHFLTEPDGKASSKADVTAIMPKGIKSDVEIEVEPGLELVVYSVIDEFQPYEYSFLFKDDQLLTAVVTVLSFLSEEELSIAGAWSEQQFENFVDQDTVPAKYLYDNQALISNIGITYFGGEAISVFSIAFNDQENNTLLAYTVMKDEENMAGTIGNMNELTGSWGTTAHQLLLKYLN